MTISLNTPLTPNLNKLVAYLERVNKSGWFTNFGPLHQELTARLEAFLGVENLLLVSNGTIALQVAAKTLNLKCALTTPFSFAATSGSLIWQGMDIQYSDINESSLNLDPLKAHQAILNNEAIDSVVATHVYGNPCDVEAYEAIQNDCNVKIIYDAAHAFGVNCYGKSILSYGDASTLSFHATKIFHTVEGGAIVFKNKEDFNKAKQIINFGIKEDGSLGEIGINAKLNEYQCAVGLTLLDDIEKVLSTRRRLFQFYLERLKSIVKIPEWHCEASFNGAYMPIILKNQKQKEDLKKAFSKHDIQCRDYFSPSLNKVYDKHNSMPISEGVASTILCLPMHYHLDKEDVIFITDIIQETII